MTSRANSLGAAMITASPDDRHRTGEAQERAVLTRDVLEAGQRARPDRREVVVPRLAGSMRAVSVTAVSRTVGPDVDRGAVLESSRPAGLCGLSGSSSVVALPTVGPVPGAVVASGTVGCTVEPPSRVRERASSSVRGGGMHPHGIRHPHRRPQGVYGWWCEWCCDVLWCQCCDHRSRDPSHRGRLRTSRCPQILEQSAPVVGVSRASGGVGAPRWWVPLERPGPARGLTVIGVPPYRGTSASVDGWCRMPVPRLARGRPVAAVGPPGPSFLCSSSRHFPRLRCPKVRSPQ